MSTAIVVPSNRRVSKEFVRHIPKECQIYVVNDSEEDIPIDQDGLHSYIRIRYSDYADIFPNPAIQKEFMTIHTAGCRNVGILQAFNDGADIIINMDDDVTAGEGFVETYEKVLGDEPVWAFRTESNQKWFNTIGSRNWFARGFPYQDRIEYDHLNESAELAMPAVHMGLWEGVLDINGIDKLSLDKSEPPTFTQYGRRIYYPYKQYVPLCAMNCGARRDAALALMQIPMGWEFYSRYHLYRIEDIWGGYLWQTLFPSTVTFGAPTVEHYKQGNINWEIVSENYANILAKEFEEAVDTAGISSDGDSAFDKYSKLALALDDYSDFECPGYFSKFLKNVSRSIFSWVDMFS